MMKSDIYNGYTINIPSPDGLVHLHCLEHKPGKLEMVQITIGKSGSSLTAWADGLARMITVALRHSDLSDILSELSLISSDKAVLSAQQTPIRSAVDAVFYGLLRYRHVTSKSKTYYPPRLTQPDVW